ncbi:response regulator [Pseudomonas schmalbachii]|uniref:Response regulator n=1 Tax=Pseudomonas schmalbachii TaxID=2816993 RepID=A0ABS3TWF4_9PSED|nr:response regulator [Pseudomonas schmalbachii]MBO3276899.1 response regulator [Pseudomonas schmalbachii]
MKRIVVADEQPLTRQSIRQMLEAEGHQVIAEVDDGRDALQKALEQEPDLLVLDLVLPRLGGLEVIRQLRQRGSAVRTLVLTAQNTEHFAGLSLQAGSSGFIGKQDAPGELLEAVRAILRGRSYFPVRALGSVDAQNTRMGESDQLGSLSPRELTVLRYLASGRSNKDIAEELAISDRTVSTYKIRLLQKLNAGSLVELLEISRRNNLLGGRVPGEAAHPGVHGEAETIEEMFHAQFDGLALPFCLRDRDGVLLAYNRYFLEFHELDEGMLPLSRLTGSSRLAPEEALHLYQRYVDAVARQQPYFMDLLVLQPVRKVLRHWGIPYIRNGELVGMICFVADISDHELEILALTEANQRLESLKRERMGFMLDVGQEFRHSLESIQTLLGNALRAAPEISELPRMQLEVQSLRERLQALIDLARLENGESLLVPRSTELRQLSIEAAQRFLRQNIAIRVSIESERPATMAWIDVRRYRHMVQALLLHCARQGAREVILRTDAEEHSHAHLVWRVAAFVDAAGGVVESPATPDPRLALCMRLAELMGGELELLAPAADEPLARLTLRLTQSNS